MKYLIISLLFFSSSAFAQFSNQYVDTTGATTSWRKITFTAGHKIRYLEVANDTVATVTTQYLWVAFEDDTTFVSPFLRAYPLRGNEVRDWDDLNITHIWIKTSVGHVPARVLLLYD